jgi:hypothetical protein
MAWILTAAFFVFMYWRVMKAQERLIECAPTGMARSPLYWTGMGLVGGLLGLAFAERHVLRLDTIFIWAWFAALAVTVIALLIVRRALKGRYPI